MQATTLQYLVGFGMPLHPPAWSYLTFTQSLVALLCSWHTSVSVYDTHQSNMYHYYPLDHLLDHTRSLQSFVKA
jgi:hypothetical protein